METVDVVVVGAGFAGLTAALRLQQGRELARVAAGPFKCGPAKRGPALH